MPMNNHKPTGYPEGTMWDSATVMRRLGISRTTLDRRLANPTDNFPLPIRVGPRLLRWEASKVLAWIEAKGARG
jgi:predicted DNA-binding transcriptional regulator AlpA